MQQRCKNLKISEIKKLFNTPTPEKNIGFYTRIANAKRGGTPILQLSNIFCIFTKKKP